MAVSDRNARSVFVPDLRQDGIGGAILPGRITGTGQPALLVHFEDPNDARLKRIAQVARRAGGEVVRTLGGTRGVAAILTPGLWLDRDHWTALGVREHRLQSARSHRDPNDGVGLRRLLDDALAAVGLREEALAPRVVGTNRFGETVYDGLLGRFLARQGAWQAEWQPGADGRRKGEIAGDAFFRGERGSEAFSGSARGAAVMLLAGETFDARRLSMLYGDVLRGAPSLAERPGFRRGDFQEEIEAHLAALIVVASRRSPGRDVALRVDGGMAAHADRTGTRMALQQYSTPFPIACVAAEVLLPRAGERLLEPTAGNGVLASGFLGRGIEVTGVELDAARARRASWVLGAGSVQQGDFLDVSRTWDGPPAFDLLVANPPFDTLPTKEVRRDAFGRSVSLRGLDHLIAFEALSRLKPDGRAFLVLPGDMINHGALKGGNRYFDNWLRSTYEMAGAAVADGRLYRKMGAQFPVILYAVGPRRDAPLSSEQIQAIEPEALPLLLSHDELFAWADEARGRMAALTGLASAPEPLAAPETLDGTADGPARAGRSRPAPSGRAEAAQAPEVPTAGIEPEPEPGPESGPAIVPVPPARAAVPAPSTSIADDIEDDTFVRRYQPFSNLGEAQTEIQKSLQGLIYRALLDVEAKHGEVDAYVAGKLGLTVEDLASEDEIWGGRRFSPEQIDALALNFARQDEGKGFMVADLMGVGKGRMLAGTAMAAFAQGRPVAFFTDTPDLFTDFLARDFATVARTTLREMKAADAIRPFILNQSVEARIRDADGAVVFGTGDARAAKEHGIPEDRNAVFATHSQFQTSHGAWKLRAILEWAETSAAQGRPVHLVLDEIHKAAGEDSNTGDLIERLVDGVVATGGSVTFSSATPLKSGKNVRVFKPILPDMNMTVSELTELIEQNPLALQEVLAGEMARMGTMIAREIDTRGAQRQFVHLQEIDPDRHRKIVGAVDRAAEFLREMVEESSEVDRAAARLGSAYGAQSGGAQAKVTVMTTSPVSQFHAFSQYLMVAVKTAYHRELIVQSIASGHKPVVVLENTGQQVLARLAEREGEDRVIDGVNVRVIPRLPDMGDVLIENASKMLDVKIIDPIGGESRQRLGQFEGWLDDFSDRVRTARLEGLTLAPIDTIAQTASRLGLSMGELTKRQLMATPLESGGYAVVARDAGDKRQIIRDFNNGDLDVLTINRSAAAGVSMHASPATGWDLRPREMIKFQLQSDVTAERQIDGRVHRYGQVHDGRYKLPMTGFAADDRLMQLFNRKNRSLTATSNATRENRTNIEEAIDLLNVVGEGVVREYLIENNHITAQLGLPSPSDPAAEGNAFGRRLMGRLVCLPVATQEAVMSELDTAFRMRIEALDAKGQNPLRLSQFDWRATVEPVAVLQAGDENSEQIGKRPVTLVKLTYKEALAPISAERVERAVARGREAMLDAGGGRARTARERVGPLFDAGGEPIWSSSAYDKALNRRPEDRSLGLVPIEVEAASATWKRRHDIVFDKAAVPEKRVLRAAGYAAFLDRHLDALEPGRFLHLKTDFFPHLADTRIAADLKEEDGRDAADVPAVITRVVFKEEDPLALSGWHVSVAVPGEQYANELTVSSAFTAHEAMDPEERAMHSVPTFYRYDGASLRLPAPGSASRPDFREVVARASDVDHRWFAFDSPQWEAHVRDAFDMAPSGTVKRSLHALEGNMFVALRITQGTAGRLGQKAIYTNAAGEIRHAVILKRGESIDKIKAQLVGRIDALATVVPYRHAALIGALIGSYGTLRSLQADSHYRSEGQVSERLRPQLIDQLTLLLSRGRETDEIRSYVAEKLDVLASDLRGAMAARSPAELYVGSDAFGEAPEGTWRTSVLRTECRGADHKTWVQVSDVIDGRGLGAVAGSVGGDDAHILLCDKQVDLLFHKKGAAVLKAAEAVGVPNPLELASNFLSITHARLTKGALGLPLGSGADAAGKAAALIIHLAEASNQPIMMRGAVAKMAVVIEGHATKAHEAAVDRRFAYQSLDEADADEEDESIPRFAGA